MSIFERWGVSEVVNAAGTVTRLGGAAMPAAVLQAYRDAAGCGVRMDELQAAASRRIAAATGAEAGLVTAGASAGLTLGAAAILAGHDVGRMGRLPDARGGPDEFVVAREQRNGYDHAVRAAGARLVEVGFHEVVAGSGVRRAEAWEYEAAFGEATAGVLYVLDRASRPPLADVVKAAHRRGLPVLVDAAGELPPRANLRAVVATGADLVAFSGGKAIRGPQATGILCGRAELVSSAALQTLDMDDHPELWEPPAGFIAAQRLPGPPRQGVGRGLKVSKEQIAALLVALELFASGAYDAELPAMRRRLEVVAAAVPGACRLVERGEAAPLLYVTAGDAFGVCRRLRRGTPPVEVGHGLLGEGVLVVDPSNLDDAGAAVVARRLREELAGHAEPLTPAPR